MTIWKPKACVRSLRMNHWVLEFEICLLFVFCYLEFEERDK